ncbi:MAG: type IV pilus assembly protein PilM [Phycisphaerales bacterium]|nr:MAG: type IV pilus assembly protein PilM [Phycisphaerales bacterium]
MASGQMAWGIDVGKSALKAIKLRVLTDRLVEVVGQTYVEHDTILTDASGDRDLKITQALEKFLSQNDISADQVVVSVPGHHTLARFSPLPPVEAKKIPDLVRYEADQQIPFDMDEVIWDYQTFQEEGAPEIQVGIFAMKRELIRDYLSHFEEAGIEPIIVQAAPLALYNAALFDGMVGSGTTVLINIGTENTDLVLAGPDTLWTRSIPIGGNNFTEALVKAFKLSFAKAENLKKQAATSKYARRIFQAMRPVFADLVQELQRSIGRYTSAHRDAELTKVIGVGNAFSLPVLQKYLQQNLQLDVEHPGAFDKMQFAPGVDDDDFKARLPNFAVAYGLALQGLGVSKIETNLLPPEIARQVEWRKKRPFFGAAAAALLLASGIVWLRYSWDSGALAEIPDSPRAVSSVREAEDIMRGPQSGPPGVWAGRVLGAAEKMKQEFDTISRGGTDEEAKIDQMSQLLKNKAVLPGILQMIHEALPVPQPPLDQAQTPEEYRQAVEKLREEERIGRRDRTEVFIENLDIVHYPDLSIEELDADFVDRSGADADLVADPVDVQVPGFVVYLECRTPNRKHSQFVNSEFQRKLREAGRRPGTGFYVNRVALTSIERGEEGGRPDRGAPPRPSRRSGSSLGRGSQGPSGSGTGGPIGPPRSPEPDGRLGSSGGSAPPAGLSPRGRSGSSGPGGPDTGRGTAPRWPRGGSSAPRSDGAATVDPLTDESMDLDWLFTIALDVVLADMPQDETEAGETPADREGE